MKESADKKRLILIKAILNLSDEEVLSASIGTTSEPDATTESHEGSHPPDPPPPPPTRGGQ